MYCPPPPRSLQRQGQRRGFGPAQGGRRTTAAGGQGPGGGARAPGRWLRGAAEGGWAAVPAASPLPTPEAGTGRARRPPQGHGQRDGTCRRPGRPRGPCPAPPSAAVRPLRQGGRGCHSRRLSAQAPPSPAWMLSQSTKAKNKK